MLSEGIPGAIPKEEVDNLVKIRKDGNSFPPFSCSIVKPVTVKYDTFLAWNSMMLFFS